MKHQFTISVTMTDGSRSTYTMSAEDGFAAANDALDRYGEAGVRRIAAMNVRPALALQAGTDSVHLPVICVEGYKGPGK